jgi:transposase InsO family protein
MSGAGNCYDNAVAESFFASLKKECTSRRAFATLFGEFALELLTVQQQHRRHEAELRATTLRWESR